MAGVRDSRRRLECDHRAERVTVIFTVLGYHARRLRVPGRWAGAPEFQAARRALLLAGARTL